MWRQFSSLQVPAPRRPSSFWPESSPAPLCTGSSRPSSSGSFNYGSLGIQTVSADSFDVGRFLDFPPQLELIFGIAPFALGAGYITGRPGLLILAGGILAYHILTPLAFSLGWMPQTVSAADAPSYGFSAFNRPLGIGLLLGGAIMGIVVSLPVIKEAFRSIAAASKLKGGGDELGLRVLVTAVVLAVALLFAAAYVVGEKPFNRTCPVTGQWVGLVSVADVTGNMTEGRAPRQGRPTQPRSRRAGDGHASVRRLHHPPFE